jgi:riboflavin kinase/FMN adenylyltransferase
MNIYRDISQLPAFHKAVLTIGTFDGVHLGHMLVINQLVKEAKAIDGSSVLVSFFPHPRQVIDTHQKPIQLLSSFDEKAALLEKAGIENLVIVPFSKSFADQSADVYIRDFLVKSFTPHLIIIGYDHRFGHNREGDYHLLESAALTYGFQVQEIPQHVLSNINISSTRIREALQQGDLETVNHLLGYCYFFSGVVVSGKQLGRTIGFPTANLSITDPDKMIPANGVYAVTVVYKGPQLKGMMNVGTRPTIDGGEISVEVHLFDFDEDIYGETLRVSVIDRLRDEVKFTGIEALKTQLNNDRISALKILQQQH